MTVTLTTLALLATGCFGNYTQADALEKVTPALCDWYEKCGEISEGKKYANVRACESEVRSQWNGLWPFNECDERIRPDDLDTCLGAIEVTSCDNGLDLFNTVFNKCGKAQVCQGSPEDSGRLFPVTGREAR
jgi:hypothetical protein